MRVFTYGGAYMRLSSEYQRKFVEQRVFLLKWVVSMEVLYCCSRKKSVGVILEKKG